MALDKATRLLACENGNEADMDVNVDMDDGVLPISPRKKKMSFLDGARLESSVDIDRILDGPLVEGSESGSGSGTEDEELMGVNGGGVGGRQ